MSNFAPVVIYTYSRLDHLRETISALKANYLASKTDIFIVSDGPKDLRSKKEIRYLRDYVDSVDGFNSVNRVYRDVNIGVFQSVMQIEPAILSDYGKLITMEDDIVTSRNYLDFINAGLDFYEYSDDIYSVSGYCHPISLPENFEFDSWLSPWFCPWGYGTWKKKYDRINIEWNPLKEIKKNKEKLRFLKKHGSFFYGPLEADEKNLRVVPDARIAAQMLMLGMYTVMPRLSKVRNIGFDGSGVNCPTTNKFDVSLDEVLQRNFSFYAGQFDVSREEVASYLQFMNGNLISRLHRNWMNQLRSVEFLRKFKRTML